MFPEECCRHYAQITKTQQNIIHFTLRNTFNVIDDEGRMTYSLGQWRVKECTYFINLMPFLKINRERESDYVACVKWAYKPTNYHTILISKLNT